MHDSTKSSSKQLANSLSETLTVANYIVKGRETANWQNLRKTLNEMMP